MTLRLRDRTLELQPGRPLLMGIVNAGPDSFSDPGQRTPEALAGLGRQLVSDGASLIDVGGESGRTDRAAVPVEEEVRRVVPVVERLAADGIAVSVDTWRAPVARAALAAGAAMVNDVSALADPELAEACAASRAALVVTHTRAAPKRKAFPPYDDVVADTLALWRERAGAARERGVDDEQLLFDPGIDLAKTPAQSVELLRRLPELHEISRPLLLAVSRKDFLGAITGRPPAGREAGTLAALEACMQGGAAVVRLHDVRAAADYLRVRAALRGEEEVPEELQLDEDLRREPAAKAR
jgi:dihydropteroate synthase